MFQVVVALHDTSHHVIPVHMMMGQPASVSNQYPSPATPSPSVPMPGLGQGIGITSGSQKFSSLFSSPQSYVGNIGGGCSSPQYFPASTSGPAGWSEARPVIGNRWEDMTLLPSGLPFGSTSGYPNLLALSPSPQSSIGFVSSYQTPPQPPSPSGSPAYCFHCMQYGAVYTINQV